MKLAEIANRINAHMKRFEADPEINADTSEGGTGLHRFYHAGAAAAGRYVGVWYVSFQGHFHLTKAEAEEYLAWLDAGGEGRHYEAFRDTGRRGR